MVVGSGVWILVFGCDAQIEEHARGFLLVEREVFRGRRLGLQTIVALARHALERGAHLRDQIGRVDHRVVQLHHLHVGLGTRAFRDVLGRGGQTLVDVLLHAFVVRADGADHRDLFGNDVHAVAAVDRTHGDHGRLQRDVGLAAHNRLNAGDDLRARHDRVNAGPGACAMGLLARHVDPELIDRRHRRARTPCDPTGGIGARHVQTKDGIDLGVLHGPFLDHLLGTPDLFAIGLEGGRCFFGGLEDELHAAGQLVLHAGQHFRRGHQHGHMGVVAAGVHDVDFLAEVHALGLGGKRHIDLLLHRQRIHVGTQRHHRAGLGTLEQADHAGHRHAGLHFHAELAQMVSNQARGARFQIAQFGVFVDVATPCDQLLFDGLGALVDLSVQRLCLGRLRGGNGCCGAGCGLRERAGGRHSGKGQCGQCCQRGALEAGGRCVGGGSGKAGSNTHVVLHHLQVSPKIKPARCDPST